MSTLRGFRSPGDVASVVWLVSEAYFLLGLRCMSHVWYAITDGICFRVSFEPYPRMHTPRGVVFFVRRIPGPSGRRVLPTSTIFLLFILTGVMFFLLFVFPRSC